MVHFFKTYHYLRNDPEFKGKYYYVDIYYKDDDNFDFVLLEKYDDEDELADLKADYVIEGMTTLIKFKNKSERFNIMYPRRVADLDVFRMAVKECVKKSKN